MQKDIEGKTGLIWGMLTFEKKVKTERKKKEAEKKK